MQERERLLREAFARYEARGAADREARRDDVLAAVAAFCAAPPERESAEPPDPYVISRRKALEIIESAWTWARLTEKTLREALEPEAASVPPEAAAETPCDCERCREYRKSQEWLANTAPNQAASPPAVLLPDAQPPDVRRVEYSTYLPPTPTQAASPPAAPTCLARLENGQTCMIEAGHDGAHFWTDIPVAQPTPEPWRVSEVVVRRFLSAWKNGEYSAEHDGLIGDVAEDCLDARAQLAEAQREIEDGKRTWVAQSQIIGSTIQRAEAAEHELAEARDKLSNLHHFKQRAEAAERREQALRERERQCLAWFDVMQSKGGDEFPNVGDVLRHWPVSLIAEMRAEVKP